MCASGGGLEMSVIFGIVDNRSAAADNPILSVFGQNGQITTNKVTLDRQQYLVSFNKG